MSSNPPQNEENPSSSAPPGKDENLDKEDATQMTCDVLCSLSEGPTAPAVDEKSSSKKKQHKTICPKVCPKQHQLPMFLSKTYHMIDKCDAEVATWSDGGDNFVVKNVERFASSVLPLYFKHSNFSSFARQLNFYGFRKLRTESILTNDVDPSTACYVRFYHEKFQKDKPELLHEIKRATKSDQQSKDDVEVLKTEIANLKQALAQATAEYDRKLAEVSYDCNRRISSMTTEYDKLALLVQQTIGVAASAPGSAAATAPVLPTAAGSAPSDLLHSLSQAAISLQSHLRPNGAATMLGLAATSAGGAAKRPAAAEETTSSTMSGGAAESSSNKKARTDGAQT